MGATVDAIAAYDAFSKGDNVSGGLYVAQGTGMMMATFGASAASGLEAAGVAGAAALGGPIVWVSVGIMAVAAVGMWAWNDHKANSQHEPDFDKGRSLAAGFTITGTDPVDPATQPPSADEISELVAIIPASLFVMPQVAISIHGVVARPHSADASVNSARPHKMTGRRPKLSDSAP